MKQTSSFPLVRGGVGALALAFALLVDRPVRALPLQEIIARTERAVVHVSVLDAAGGAVATGSGFLVSSDGRVVTNHHVVDEAERVEVVFQDGKEVEVLGVLAFDAGADLAVLQLPSGTYPKLSLSGEAVKQGDSIVVIGSPMGFSGSVSTGIVSAVRPEGAHYHNEHRPNWNFQLTAATSPGSSGSPVMNEDGEVVAIAVGGFDGESLNFGVPVALLKKLLPAGKKEPSPLRVLRGGRSRLTNILISIGAIGGVAIAAWGTSWFLGRKRRRERHQGRDVVGSILKH